MTGARFASFPPPSCPLSLCRGWMKRGADPSDPSWTFSGQRFETMCVCVRLCVGGCGSHLLTPMTFREGSNRHQDLGSEQAPASPGYQDGRTNIMFNLLQNKEGMDQTRDPEKGVVLFFPRLIQRQLARIWKGHPGKWPWPPSHSVVTGRYSKSLRFQKGRANWGRHGRWFPIKFIGFLYEVYPANIACADLFWSIIRFL